MQKIYSAGKYFYAIGILAFGIIQIITKNFMTGLLPVPETMPGRIIFMYIVSAIFILASIFIIINKATKQKSFLLGFLWLILLIYPNAFILLQNIQDPNQWTVAAETLAMGCGAFTVALYINSFGANRAKNISAICRYIFAIVAVIFAVLHFKYFDFIVTLLPSWMPEPKVWCWLVLFAFTATALSLLLNILVKFSMTLYGLMFLIWVIILHAPRVFENPHTEAEWSSMFIALAMSGIAFMMAENSEKKFY